MVRQSARRHAGVMSAKPASLCWFLVSPRCWTQPRCHSPRRLRCRHPGPPDRAAVDRKLLTYTTAPLRHATTMTGLGRVTLDVTSIRGASHGALHAYLEDVQRGGRVTYVTEGELAFADRAVGAQARRSRVAGGRAPALQRRSAPPFPLGERHGGVIDLLPTCGPFPRRREDPDSDRRR